MDKTQKKLLEKTEKRLEKLESKLEDIESGHEELENIYAYEKDTKHFIEEDDYIRAWESVVYAWGILETLERIGEIEKEN